MKPISTSSRPLENVQIAQRRSFSPGRTAGASFAAGVLFAALAVPAFQSTFAAGLEKIRVLSGLGQPLRAEIDVTSAGDDVDTLAVRLAPAAAFSQAGVEYSQSLSSLRFTIDRHSDGQPFVRVTSIQPINDPYVDMLVELNWSSGRLVRQYTFLLDPPEFKSGASGQTAAASSAPYVSPFPASTSVTRAAPRAARSRRNVPSETTAPSGPAGAGETYVVAPGDTAFKIARANKPAGASIDQMLVALFRDNPAAFDGQNINRLKAGAVVRIPDAQAATGIEQGEARRQLSAHMNDFAGVRSAAAAAVERAPATAPTELQPAASGKLTKPVDVPTATGASQDQVRLSPGQAGKPDASIPGKAAGAVGSAEDAAAKERMVQEANNRVALLEKNVADLEKLLQLKNQNLSDLQKQVQGKSPESTGAAPGSGAATPSSLPPSTSAPESASPVADAARPAPAAQAPAKAADAKPASTQPGFFEGLLSNSLALYGILGILLVLLLLAAYQMRRKSRQGKFEDSFLGGNSGMRANSLFGITGGQSVDTSNSTFGSNFLPQTGQPEANEVDPIAEAEVYIAYGRDAQAEEILKEALRTQPQRHGVRLKLLEIYAKRADVKSFETVANELYAATGGQGDEWQQAIALGRTVDSANPLFAETKAKATSLGAEFEPFPVARYTPKTTPATPASSVPSPTATEISPAPSSAASSSGMATSSAGLTSSVRNAVQSSYSGPIQIEPVLDTNLVKTEPFTAADSLTMNTEPRIPPDAELDFTLGSEVFPAAGTPASPELSEGGLNWAQRSSVDFNFDLQDGSGQSTEPFAHTATVPDPASPPTPAPPSGLPATPIGSLLKTVYSPRPGGTHLEAEDLGGTRVVASTGTSSDNATSDFGGPFTATDTIALGTPQRRMPDVDLDFAQEAGRTTVLSGPQRTSNWQEMATKLDLAVAYRDIGDKEGARELLGEVVRAGDAVQVQKANELLAGLG